MENKASVIRVSKLNAASRQLQMAITLWFTGGDPIAIHTLAVAAYEVLHTLSKKRDPNRRDLLFDSDHIKDEFRTDWIKLIKKHANFFKHADRDGDSVIEFDPEMNEWYIMYASVARALCGEPQSSEESTFLWWFQVHKPHLLTEKGRQMVADRIPIDNLEEIRTWPKRKFFEAMSEARRLSGRRFAIQPSLD
jgi:hypothetical protein